MSPTNRYWYRDLMNDGSCVTGGYGTLCGFQADYDVDIEKGLIELVRVSLNRGMFCGMHRENDPALFRFAKQQLPRARQRVERDLEAR